MSVTIHTPVTAAPVLVYTAATIGSASVVLTNEGTQPVYIGGNLGVTPANGFLIPVNAVHKIPAAPANLFACSSYTVTATTTTVAAATNSGATSLTVASGAGFANGAQIVLGSGTNAEVVTLTAGGGTTTFTITAAQYDHRAAMTIALVTALGTAIHTEAATA